MTSHYEGFDALCMNNFGRSMIATWGFKNNNVVLLQCKNTMFIL